MNATPTSALVQVFERITGTKAQARTAAAVSRFGPYLIGMTAAKGLSTVGQLLISRWLGPTEFGRLAIVISTSTMLALPLAAAWGSTFVRYAAGQPKRIWAPLLQWTSRRALLTTAILATAVVLCSPLLAPLLSVPRRLLVGGAILAIAMAIWLLAKAASQGREEWRRFVASELAFGATAASMTAILMFVFRATWWAAALVLAVAYIAGSIPAVRLFRTAGGSLRTDAERDAPENSSREYVRFALLTGAANTAFLNIDCFAVQHALGFSEVGIYQVYNVATIAIAMLLSTLLYNFVFPLFPQGDRLAFASLFRNGFLRLLPLTLSALFVAGWIEVRVAGFPFRPLLLACATLSAASLLVGAFYGHLVASLGVNGAKLSAKVAVVNVVSFAIAVVPAVRVAGLGGVFALYGTLFLTAAIFYNQALRRLPAETLSVSALAARSS